MEKLDTLIQHHMNRRLHKCRMLKVAGIKKESLAQLRRQDISWINMACEKGGYDVRDYLEYYNSRI